jgi:hypothetical protein
MSLMTEAVIPEVFKRMLLWGHQDKDYHKQTVTQYSKDHRMKKLQMLGKPGVQG